MNNIILKQPTKARKSKHYLIMITDADGVDHYWNPDGTYDGFGAKVNNTKSSQEEHKK